MSLSPVHERSSPDLQHASAPALAAFLKRIFAFRTCYRQRIQRFS